MEMHAKGDAGLRWGNWTPGSQINTTDSRLWGNLSPEKHSCLSSPDVWLWRKNGLLYFYMMCPLFLFPFFFLLSWKNDLGLMNLILFNTHTTHTNTHTDGYAPPPSKASPFSLHCTTAPSFQPSPTTQWLIGNFMPLFWTPHIRKWLMTTAWHRPITIYESRPRRAVPLSHWNYYPECRPVIGFPLLTTAGNKGLFCTTRANVVFCLFPLPHGLAPILKARKRVSECTTKLWRKALCLSGWKGINT